MDETLESQKQAAAESWVRIDVSRGLASVRQLIAARKVEVVCAALLFVMVANLFAVISRKSITNDELVHIPAGYYHLVAGKFQLNNEHPPLVKMWAALPLLFIQPNEASTDAAAGNFSEETWKTMGQFWPNNREHFEAIFFWTRAMMILITLALGILIFIYARDLFGARAATFAVALYTLEPTILAHGRIVHTDLPATFAFLLFFFALRYYFKTRSTRRALLLGLASGLALVVKFSMIVIWPVLAAVAIAGFIFAARWQESRKRIAIHLGIVVCVMLFLVNAAYYFRSPPIEAADVKWVQTMSAPSFNNWMKFFQVGSKVVPTYWLFGQYNVWLHNRDGHPTSLLGQYNQNGWWYYFPVAFALKTSLPFLLIATAALAWMLWSVWKRHWRFLWLLLPFAIYTAMSMSSNINIGIRHFLPAYSFLFIVAGAFLDRILRVKYAHHLIVATVVLLFGWMSVEMLRAYPDYIPYMNQLASGHPHWWYLSDSNVEWGDDARALAEYLHAHGETDVRGALSGGWGTLGFYGIGYHEMLPKPGRVIPETRYVAIGAGFLNGSTIAIPADEHGQLVSEQERINYLAAYRTRVPEAIFGNSIFLYRLKD
jgi:hypothetical protein